MNLVQRAGLSCLFFLTAICSQAFSEDNQAAVEAATASAKGWLTQIDTGRYDDSYAAGCLAFHNKVSHEQWVTVLKALRVPLGPLVSRKVAKSVYHPDGFAGLEGECVVITYNTTFGKLPSDTEIVVMKHENGQWRGAGYNSQPQTEADSDSPPPATAHTEVNSKEVH